MENQSDSTCDARRGSAVGTTRINFAFRFAADVGSKRPVRIWGGGGERRGKERTNSHKIAGGGGGG